ncbi:MAG: Na/Pi cotransporter family protein [Clostridia bacterium]|nr:Na/Pi cotransporter family protein [Clostridia bacterium]
MDIFAILTLAGGLGLFLYGMEVMGDSLKKLAGGKLEMILSKLTANRFIGFLLGFFVTSIIQSSSATTVMLVGFVNSGIMKLGQTIAVIMGANVGTTVTAWLLSLSGIDGSGPIWLKLLKPTSFTPVLMVIGVVMVMACKSDKKKNIASILIGFAVLMFGMDMMSGAMSGLKDDPSFRNLLIAFENPILAILAGTILTAIIQSSSASVGILQALALSCDIPFTVAIPVILGQNIGTTITPVISSITGNTESKRVAISCVYIKVIGVTIVFSAFSILHSIFDFPFMHMNATIAGIATVHTVYNVIAASILIWFSKPIAALAVKTIRSKKQEEVSEFDVLDDRFLSIPSVAVERCRELVCTMSMKARDAVIDATSLIEKYNKELVDKIIDSENLIDVYEDKISSYLVKIAKTDLSDADSKTTTELLQCISDIERISDYSAIITQNLEEIERKELKFSDSALSELNVISSAVTELIAMTHEAFEKDDLAVAKNVEPLRQVVDRLKVKIKTNHVVRLQEGKCSIEMGLILSDLLNNYSRIADHCSNVAVCMLEIDRDSMEAHGHVSNMVHTEEFFTEQYKMYKEKYSIAK